MAESDNRFENWLCKACGFQHKPEYAPTMQYREQVEDLKLICVRCCYSEAFPLWKHYQDT